MENKLSNIVVTIWLFSALVYLALGLFYGRHTASSSSGIATEFTKEGTPEMVETIFGITRAIAYSGLWIYILLIIFGL